MLRSRTTGAFGQYIVYNKSCAVSLALLPDDLKSRLQVVRHLANYLRGWRAPGQGIAQGVIGGPYASVPITGNQIPKFQFPMLSRSPRDQISAQLCQTSSQSISQDQDISRSALCACAATSGSGLRQEAAQSCCYTSGTLFAAKDIGGKYTEGLLPSSSLMYIQITPRMCTTSGWWNLQGVSG